MKKEPVKEETPPQEEEYVEEEQPMYEPIPPQPEMGLPPSKQIEVLKYYGENEPLREEGKKITGDVPQWLKARFSVLNNKNMVNGNFNENDERSINLKSQMLKRKFLMSCPEELKTPELMLDLDMQMMDFKARLTQGRDSMNRKLIATQYQYSLVGQVNQDQNNPQALNKNTRL